MPLLSPYRRHRPANRRFLPADQDVAPQEGPGVCSIDSQNKAVVQSSQSPSCWRWIAGGGDKP